MKAKTRLKHPILHDGQGKSYTVKPDQTKPASNDGVKFTFRPTEAAAFVLLKAGKLRYQDRSLLINEAIVAHFKGHAGKRFAADVAKATSAVN